MRLHPGRSLRIILPRSFLIDLSELISHHCNLLIDIRLDVLGCCLVDHSELTGFLVVIPDHLIEPEDFIAILFIKLVLASHVLRLSV